MQSLDRAARWIVALALVACGVGGRPVTAAPARPGAPAKSGGVAPFRFAVYGDTRNGHETHRQIVSLILKQDPAFVLQTGDLVGSGKDEAQWKVYDEITAPLRAALTIYPARGNHDGGGTGYEARVPSAFTTGTSGTKLWYSFWYRGCHFVSLDTISPFGPRSPQYAWLLKDLEAAKAARHIFVFFHDPPYSVGPHGDSASVQRDLVPLLRKYGVRLVFNGHDHIYYRTIRDGIPYIVTGGGGAPLYNPDKKENGIPGDVVERANNIVVCEVDGPTVRVRALRLDGTVLDQFSVPSAVPISNRGK